ncbi:serine hydrolase domain-containing protein [Xanthomonas sp. WHRI 7065]|uniref:serine hydrolase domain-containing protein n=1 Tax=Xanthomonas sp. WHRI 7065 TaxID=3161569 RepID=UPI0032E89E0E
MVASIKRRTVLAAALSMALPMRSFAKPGIEADSVSSALRRRVAEEKQGTGAVLGVVRAGELKTFHYGTVGLGKLQQPNDRSVFQIASLTKIFTALLLADCVQRGEVNLADPLSMYIAVPPATFDGNEITLLDLATHTSGLPLRPFSRTGLSQDNPYAGYTESDLCADLGRVRLTRLPGSSFEYSNFDYALLGYALSQRLGKTYADLLRARILEPLRMDETTLAPSTEMQRREIGGYDADFHSAQPWEFGALAPAGGLFSTVKDLSKFMTLWTNKESGPLSRAASMMLTVDRPGDNTDTRMGIGWRKVHPDGQSIAWSNGNGGGVRSFMGFNADTRVAAIAFINKTSSFGVDDIALGMLAPAGSHVPPFF